MNRAEVTSVRTPHANVLAAAVRRVNKIHAEAGEPHLLELDRLWLGLTTALELAAAAGDDVAALRTIARWHTLATDEILRPR